MSLRSRFHVKAFRVLTRAYHYLYTIYIQYTKNANNTLILRLAIPKSHNIYIYIDRYCTCIKHVCIAYTVS